MFDLDMHKMDVSTAYLNSYIDKDEEAYMIQPDGYKQPGKEDFVCKLIRSIYGLPQSARNWYKKIYDDFIKLGFKQSYQDPCVFTKINDKTGDTIILGIFVDDIIILSNNAKQKDELVADLERIYKIKNLGNCKNI